MSGAAVNVGEEQDVFLSHFEWLTKERAGQDPSWLQSIRRSAMERFAQLGFPHGRLEEWRFTNVAPIKKIPFQLAARDDQRVTIDRVRPLMFGEGPRLVLVNGRFCPELSEVSSLPRGAIVTGLEQAVKTYPERVEAHLARYADIKNHAFTALNTAFITDGAFVYIPSGVVVEAPLHLLFLSTTREAALVSHPRNLIIVESNSRVHIVEDYAGASERPCFTNPVTEVVVKENASVDHYRLVRESLHTFHIATQQTHEGRDARYLSYSLTLGGALIRNDISVVLGGEGSECTLNGFYVVKDRQHVDHHTRIDHATPHSNSREFYKGILD
ncbi:MAG: Fe-S cluster assembly protein SufD, partial [Acidobacteria bacterium]